MTATYDGRLISGKDGVWACCRMMDELVMMGMVYSSTRNVVMLRTQEKPKRGVAIMCCPFCGSEAEVKP